MSNRNAGSEPADGDAALVTELTRLLDELEHLDEWLATRPADEWAVGETVGAPVVDGSRAAADGADDGDADRLLHLTRAAVAIATNFARVLLGERTGSASRSFEHLVVARWIGEVEADGRRTLLATLALDTVARFVDSADEPPLTDRRAELASGIARQLPAVPSDEPPADRGSGTVDYDGARDAARARNVWDALEAVRLLGVPTVELRFGTTEFRALDRAAADWADRTRRTVAAWARTGRRAVTAPSRPALPTAEPQAEPAPAPVPEAAPETAPEAAIGSDDLTSSLVSAKAVPRDDGSAEVAVWFGTNRAPRSGADPSKGFGADFAAELRFGRCTVNVPASHLPGSVGAPWWRRLWPFGRRDDPLTVTANAPFESAAAFADALATALDAHPAGERSAILYIHGYNSSFDNAVIRAAQIAFDLKTAGEVCLFSWPSKARARAYMADVAMAEASEPQLLEFLTVLRDVRGIERLDVIVHSMGNLVLARALDNLLQSTTPLGIRLGTIVLAAPDVDVLLFSNLARAYPQLTDNTTLYVSRADHALALSGALRSSPRAGFVPPITVVPGIDTVLVPEFDLSLLGHGYYAEAGPVFEDIRSLLGGAHDPGSRAGLTAAVDGTGAYWALG